MTHTVAAYSQSRGSRASCRCRRTTCNLQTKPCTNETSTRAPCANCQLSTVPPKCPRTDDGVHARVLCNDCAQVGRKVEQGAGHGLGERQAGIELAGRHPGVGRVGADLCEGWRKARELERV